MLASGAYVCAGKIGLLFAYLNLSASPVWPASGLGFAILLLGGPRFWPAIFAGALTVNITTTWQLWPSFVIAVGNTLEALCACLLVRRFANGVHVFETVAGVLRFILSAAVLSTCISASIGVGTLDLAGLVASADLLAVWTTWWIGDATGMLMFAPLLVLLSNRAAIEQEVFKRRSVLEYALSLAVLLLTADAVFGALLFRNNGHYPVAFTCAPLVVWAALRFGQRDAVLAAMLMAAIATAATLQGNGPFAAVGQNHALLIAQSFAAFLMICGLVFSASAIERARLERALRLREQEYRAVVENSNEGIWVVGADGHVRYVNERAAELLGYPVAEIVGRPLLNFLAEDDRPAAIDRAERRRRLGAREQFDVRMLHKDGILLWVQACTVPRYNSSGEYDGAIGMISDIRDRKALELHLMTQAQQLSDTGRRKDEFLAMLAHELRNPLSAISSVVQLHRRLPERMSSSSMSEVVERQVKQLARLLDDLLDVSRITWGKIQLRKERLDFVSVAQRVIDSLSSAVEQKGHTVQFTAAKPVLLDADPARLEQMLGNLLTNAIKYTEPGGTIFLECGCESGEAVITVRDNGIGMSAETLGSLFEPFTQAERSLDRSQGGLGVGLALVRRLAEMHGGTAAAHSAGLGMGSVFTVRLPAAQARDTVEPQRPAEVTMLRRITRSRVLVVDDNNDTALATAATLRGLGYQTQVAFDGVQALEAAQISKPDAVLLDLGLPRLNGYEVARRIRADESMRHALIIAISGYGQEQDRSRSQAAGVDHHLLKPINFDELLQLLEQPQVPQGAAAVSDRAAAAPDRRERDNAA